MFALQESYRSQEARSMTTIVAGREMPLARASMRLGMRHWQAYNALLSGELEGRQLANGRWIVLTASVERLERNRQDMATANVAGRAS
jgi:hypothetical protein